MPRSSEYGYPVVLGTRTSAPDPTIGRRQRLNVVVEVELPRVGAELYFGDLALPLERDPRVDHVGREHVALQQEVVVGFERGKRLVQRTRHLRHLGELLRRQVVQVAVEGLGRLDAV